MTALPTWFAPAMIGMGAVSSTIGGIAQYKQGRSEKAAYDYNADIVLRRMKEQEESSRQEFTRLMGRQKTLYGKAGVDISSGSPLLVLADTAMKAEQEQQRIYTAGHEEAELQRYYGRVASWGGTMGGLSTFLTGLGKAGMQYYQYEKGV